MIYCTNFHDLIWFRLPVLKSSVSHKRWKQIAFFQKEVINTTCRNLDTVVDYIDNTQKENCQATFDSFHVTSAPHKKIVDVNIDILIVEKMMGTFLLWLAYN